jgi:hypothetical protein
MGQNPMVQIEYERAIALGGMLDAARSEGVDRA